MNRRHFQQLLLATGAAAFIPFRAHAAAGTAFTAADELVRRLLGEAVAKQIRCELVPAQSDSYTITSDGSMLVLRGNSPITIAAALNDWLRHEAKRQASWTGDNLQLDGPIPLPAAPRSAKAALPYRVAYNFCTFGYTMAWWDWAQWEKELDFMALMGVNMPLAMVGHECVWRNVLTTLGMSDEAVRNFLCGPCYLPWQFMANIDSWAGPMPASWLDSHEKLGRKIWDRMRELGMTPISPGFTGYVPNALKDLKKGAKIFSKPDWFGFPGVGQLDPADPLFAEISKLFVKEQTRLFGASHWHACDIFHESSPPSNDPAYLSAVGKMLIDTLIEADPEAKIAMQTWSLYEPIVKAIPKDRLLLLHLTGDPKDFWGYPFVSGLIHNFGGRVYLGGDLPLALASDSFAVRKDYVNCQGLGFFCEGNRNNSPIYMAMLEGAFRAPGASDNPKNWMREWAQARFGVKDGPAIEAWVSTLDHVYAAKSEASSQSGETAFCMRPSLHGASSSPSNGSFARSYPLEKLRAACKILAEDAQRLGHLETYRYDLVDWTRQVLADTGLVAHKNLLTAYQKGDADAFRKSADAFLTLGSDLNRLLGTVRDFRLGTWLSEARRWGTTDAEKHLLERSARMLITLWGPNVQAQVNFDYSNREWHGIMDSFYLERWRKYLAFLLEELKKPAELRLDDSKILKSYGRPGPDDHPFFKDLAAWEWNWADQCPGTFTSDPEGDPVATALEMLHKY